MLVKVLHSGDQLPFGPHSDAVWHESVDDLESQWRGKFEVLHCEADGGGALADHADVRRCSEELEEARARVLLFAEAQRQRIPVQLRNTESDSDGAPEDKEKISRERPSSPVSGRARSGASGADLNGAVAGVRVSGEEHQIEMDVRRDTEGLAGRQARTEGTRERCRAPATATRVRQNDCGAQEAYRQGAQRSKEAYLSRQTVEAIPTKLEDGASETAAANACVSSHVEACQRPHVTNGCGQRRQAVPLELQRSQVGSGLTIRTDTTLLRG
jgi:hypothetical protein